MRPCYVDKQSLRRLADLVSPSKSIIAPARHRDSFLFRKMSPGEEPCLDYSNTAVPPKFVLLPQLEPLFLYDMRRGEAKSVDQLSNDIVLLGVRPCDSSAFVILDKVMSGQYTDPYYAARKGRTTVIGISCSEPAPSCFCDSMGTGPTEGASDDITLTEIDGGYVARPRTMKGMRFIEEMKGVFRSATNAEVEQGEARAKLVRDKLRGGLEIEGLQERMSAAFSDPYWQEISRRCIECGICSFVCPTCYCFDVTESVLGNRGTRSRGWDSCQFCTFSRMAGGLDPRPARSDRLKHRFYHKLVYMPRTFGATSCVGCGRCATRCPSNVDIVEVMLRWS